jgi:hypothetical protein
VTALLDIATCSFVKVDRRVRGAYCLHHQCDEFLLPVPDLVHVTDSQTGNESTARISVTFSCKRA